MNKKATFPVAVVTGLSGSGKSTALRVFEDLRFFCVDGLPAAMVPKLIALFSGEEAKYKGLALGMDLRQQDFVDEWDKASAELARMGLPVKVVFLEARLEMLVRRYATTRRPHPLESRNLGLEQALEEERRILLPIRNAADLVIDTTHYSIHDLRRAIQEKWSSLEAHGGGLRTHVISFGFKYGVPIEADLVFDLRFLPNPFFDEALKPLSGKDPAIAEYVLGRTPGKVFIERFLDFLLYLVPLYENEGRYRLTIAVGCTGGRHRSVAVAERIHKTLKEAGYSTSIEHRHLELG